MFNAINLFLSLKGGDYTVVEIKTLPDFYVAGISLITTANNPDISKIWKQLLTSDSINDLIDKSNGNSFGVCYDMQDNEQMKYLAGWQVDNPEKLSTFLLILC